MTNTRVTLASRPNGMIKPTDFKIVQEDLPELKDGEVLVKQVYMSLDPAMRGWLDEDEAATCHQSASAKPCAALASAS